MQHKACQARINGECLKRQREKNILMILGRCKFAQVCVHLILYGEVAYCRGM